MLEIDGIERGPSARLHLLRKVAGGGYLLAALTSVIGLLAPDPVPGDDRAVIVLGIVMVLLGGALLAGRRLAGWVVTLLAIFGGTLCTSAAIAFIHPMNVVPIYYIYPAMTSGYFATRRVAHLQLMVTAAGLAAALLISPVEQGLLVFLATVSIVALVTLWVQRINAENESLVERLAEVASIDGLTGLLNRRTLSAAFARELERARLAHLPISVVLFDLDHFKLVNDRHGHAAGDAALVRFAQVLREESGSTDVAARMGGEEFIAVLFGRDEDGARGWAEHVAARLQDESTTAGLPLTTSAGVATSPLGEGEADALLLDADRALYAAKGAGRRCVMAAGDPGVGPLARAA